MPSVKLADASEIISGIWVSNEKASQCKNFFEAHNIEAVVNCTPEVPNKFCEKDVEYMRLTLGDSRDPDDLKRMEKYLEHAVSFVEKNRDLEGKNVLVHCHQGIQRSATVVASYLMKNKGMSYDEVTNFIPYRRKQGFYGGEYKTFEKQLRNFEKNLKK